MIDSKLTSIQNHWIEQNLYRVYQKMEEYNLKNDEVYSILTTILIQTAVNYKTQDEFIQALNNKLANACTQIILGELSEMKSSTLSLDFLCECKNKQCLKAIEDKSDICQVLDYIIKKEESEK